MAKAASVPGSSRRCRRRGAGGESAAGVGNDEAAPGQLLLLEILHDGGHGLRRVAADQKRRPGAGDVGHGERQAAVDAQGPDAGGGSG